MGKPQLIQLPNYQNYQNTIKVKTPTLFWIPFSSLSLVAIIGIKKLHISTSISAIILKIQIKKIFSFLFYFLSLSWQPNNVRNTKQCHFKHCTMNPLSLKTMNAVFPLALILCARPRTSTYWSFNGLANLPISVQTLVQGATFDWRSKIGTSP